MRHKRRRARMMVLVSACLGALLWPTYGQASEPEALPPTSRTNGRDEGQFLIDTTVSGIPMATWQQNPGAAFDGTNYLVVWEDEVLSGIWAARVGRDDSVLDFSGIRLPAARGHAPVAAFDLSNYLVVWEEDSTIRGGRVSAAGTVLDSAAIHVGDGGVAPALAFGGTCYLAVWGGRDLRAARVNPDGVVLATHAIVICSAASVQETPAVVFNGTDFLVVWQDLRSGYYDIYGARVTPSGFVRDPNGFLVSSANYSQWYPEVACDGGNCLVVWQDYRGGGEFDVYGSRVSPDGTVLDPDGFPIATPALYERYPCVAFGPSNYLVTWEKWESSGNQGIFASRVTRSGTVLDTAGISIDTAAQGRAPVLFDGTDYCVVTLPGTIRLTYVDTAGAVRNPAGTWVYLSRVNRQRWPAVAFNGENYLVVWLDEDRYDSAIVRGNRVGQSGNTLDSVPVTISSDYYPETEPAAASDGANYLVVWVDRTWAPRIVGSRVGGTGVLLDTMPFGIVPPADSELHPAIAFNGENYLVVWYDFGGFSPGVYGARVSGNGVVLDPDGLLVCDSVPMPTGPAVASDGTGWLVTWDDGRQTLPHIYGARVDRYGTVLDPQGLLLARGGFLQQSSALAFDGTNFLVAWLERNQRTQGVRVAPSGAVLDSPAIAIAQTGLRCRYPAVAREGEAWTVVWELGNSLYGGRVNPDGMVIDSFCVVSEESVAVTPALATGPAGQAMLAYSGHTRDIQGHACDAMRIWGKLSPIGAVEEQRKTPGASRLTLEAWPNPFRRTTTITLNCGRTSGPLRLNIYDVSGRIVRILAAGRPQSAVSSFDWNGTDDSGRRLPAGAYLCRLAAGPGRGRAAATALVVLGR